MLAAALAQPEAPFTGDLPGPLAEPLHFPNPALARWPILALLAIAGLWWLYRRSRRAEEGPAVTAPVARPRPERTGLAQALYDLREQTLKSGNFREGCHQLASLLKSHFARTGFGSRERVPCTRMTAREIRQAVGKTAASRLLIRLEDLRFGKAEPVQGSFQQVCRRAQKVTGAKARTVGGDDADEDDEGDGDD